MSDIGARKLWFLRSGNVYWTTDDELIRHFDDSLMAYMQATHLNQREKGFYSGGIIPWQVVSFTLDEAKALYEETLSDAKISVESHRP